MSEESWKSALAANLSRLRKKHGYTQSGLGELLSYSDKSISKWERGEGVPDVAVLVKLSEMYGVSVDELLGKNVPKAVPTQKPMKWYLALLSNVSAIVLGCALIIYLLLVILTDFENSWLTFMAGLPVLFIALGICFIIWKKRYIAFGAFSLALWCLCVFIHLAFLPNKNPRILYTAAGILQAASIIACGFKMLSSEKKTSGQ